MYSALHSGSSPAAAGHSGFLHWSTHGRISAAASLQTAQGTVLCALYMMILRLSISTLKYLTGAIGHSSGPQLTRSVLAVTNGAFEFALAGGDHCKSGVPRCNRPKVDRRSNQNLSDCSSPFISHKPNFRIIEVQRHSSIEECLLSALQ